MIHLTQPAGWSHATETVRWLVPHLTQPAGWSQAAETARWLVAPPNPAGWLVTYHKESPLAGTVSRTQPPGWSHATETARWLVPHLTQPAGRSHATYSPLAGARSLTWPPGWSHATETARWLVPYHCPSPLAGATCHAARWLVHHHGPRHRMAHWLVSHHQMFRLWTPPTDVVTDRRLSTRHGVGPLAGTSSGDPRNAH